MGALQWSLEAEGPGVAMEGLLAHQTRGTQGEVKREAESILLGVQSCEQWAAPLCGAAPPPLPGVPASPSPLFLAPGA